MNRAGVTKWLGFQLALLVFFNSIATGFVYLDFKLRENFIATVLCINKEKPKLQCHGKCYLKQQLKKAVDQDNEQKQSSPRKVEQEVLFFSHLVSFDWVTPIKSDREVHWILDETYSSISTSEIFHPPQI